MRTTSILAGSAAGLLALAMSTRAPQASGPLAWVARPLGRIESTRTPVYGPTVLLNDRGVVGGVIRRRFSVNGYRFEADAPFLWDGRELLPQRQVEPNPVEIWSLLRLTNTERPRLLYHFHTSYPHVAAWDGATLVRLFRGAPGWVQSLHVRYAAMNDAGTLLVEGDQGDGHDPRALLWDAERQQLTLLWDGTGEYVYPLGLNAQQDFAYQRGSIAFFRSRSGDERQLPDLGGRYLLNGGTPPMLVGAPPEPTGHVAWVWTEGAGAQPLAFLPGEAVTVQGINDAGDVLFTRRPATGAPKAMLWHDDNANGIPEPDEMRDLTPPGFSRSVGRFLNSREEALVSVFRSSEDERWMIWRAGEFIPVRYIIRGEAGAPHVEAFNSRDQIVLTVGGNTLPVTHQPNPEADAYLLDPTGS